MTEKIAEMGKRVGIKVEDRLRKLKVTVGVAAAKTSVRFQQNTTSIGIQFRTVLIVAFYMKIGSGAYPSRNEMKIVRYSATLSVERVN